MTFGSSAGFLAELWTPPVSSRPQLRPWYFVICFGLVSLFADMVYEGGRSIIGPYLATLGASAAVVGTVAGIGEFIGYGLRVASGYLVQRRGHYWTWTITGYALTVLSVPLIGSTSSVTTALTVESRTPLTIPQIATPTQTRVALSVKAMALMPAATGTASRTRGPRRS